LYVAAANVIGVGVLGTCIIVLEGVGGAVGHATVSKNIELIVTPDPPGTDHDAVGLVDAVTVIEQVHVARVLAGLLIAKDGVNELLVIGAVAAEKLNVSLAVQVA
jgi:2-phospho-L-lactate transferase/gluconeogenesis factor (CofD/UPF0052 family)